MKRSAYILTILMLFLLAQPLLVNCQLQIKPPVQKSCCAKSKGWDKKSAAKKAESKDCERTAGCNPFAGYSQCQYTIVSKFFYSDGFEQLIADRISGPNEKTQSGYSTDCWQPPEIVFA